MFEAETFSEIKITAGFCFFLLLFCFALLCVGALWGWWKLTRFGTERLTGAGPRSQRGLESPGAEVGRCSLKDEGDRQGDKHGPLSTWGRRFLSFSYFTLTFLLLRVRRPSVVSLAFLRLLFSRFEDDRAGAGEGCFEALFFGLFFFLAFSCECRDFDSLDSHLWVPGRFRSAAPG